MTTSLSEKETNMETKPGNPKDTLAMNKLPIHLVPPSAIHYASLGLLEGALKYGRNNWRETGVSAVVYYDALMRHMHQWLEQDNLSADAENIHLANAIACLCILIDATEQDVLIDDRNIIANDFSPSESIERLTEFVSHLKDKFVQRKEAK